MRILYGEGEERNELYASFLKPNYLFYDKIHNFILRIKNQKKNRMFDVLKNTNNQNKNSFTNEIFENYHKFSKEINKNKLSHFP